jgi:hypothetical protein
MFDLPNWVGGAAISLFVIIIGNFIQSTIEERRERRKERKACYEEIATLATQMKDIYEKRVKIHDARLAEMGKEDRKMTSGVQREIRDEMRNVMREIEENCRTDFEIDDDVMSAIDQLDEKLIQAKREGLEDHSSDLVELCEELNTKAQETAADYESTLSRITNAF